MGGTERLVHEGDFPDRGEAGVEVFEADEVDAGHDFALPTPDGQPLNFSKMFISRHESQAVM